MKKLLKNIKSILVKCIYLIYLIAKIRLRIKTETNFLFNILFISGKLKYN